MTTRAARQLALLTLVLTSFSLAAAGRPLAPHTLGASSYEPMSPIAAYAGGRFLTTWRESLGFHGSHLMGALSDANGVRLSPHSFHIDAAPFGAYQLLGTGDSFALFWRDIDGLVQMVDVDLEGRITARRTLELPPHDDARFSWNGTHFLATMGLRSPSNTAMAMFDRNGQVVVPATTVLSFAYGFTVVVTDDGRFVAISTGSDATFAHEVTPQGFGARMTIKRYGASLSEMRPRILIGAPLSNGDVLVIWSTLAGQEAVMKTIVLHRDGTLGAESLLATSTNTIVPLDVLRSGEGYVLAYMGPGDNGQVANALWSVRLDAAGARNGEPVLVAGNVNPGDVPISPARSPGTLLVPYTHYFQTHRGMQTIAIGADGQGRAPELLSIRETRQMPPVLGAGSGQALATWTEQAGGPTALRAASISANGDPRPAVQIAPTRLAAQDTAWNGAHHLIVHQENGRLLATRVAADGTAADAAPIVLAEGTELGHTEAAVVWADTRWVVVWADGARLRSLTLTPDGTRSAARTLDVHAPIPSDWERGVSQPALAFDTKHVLLVWSEWQSGGCVGLCVTPSPNTYAARLTRTGVAFDHLPLDLDVLAAPSLSAASSGSEFLVVAGRHARVLKSDAVLHVTDARDLFDWEATSDVTWDGTSYVVALRYYGWYTNWYLGVLRLDRGAHDAAVRRGTPTLTPDVLAAPSIAAPFAGRALIGVHEGTPADGISAVIYREVDLVPLPFPPTPPRNLHLRTLTRTSYEANWDAPEEGNPDAYIVELFENNIWVVVARVPGDVRHATVHAYFPNPIFRVRAFGFGGPSAPAEHEYANPKRRSVR
jgi:hypothetical protein